MRCPSCDGLGYFEMFYDQYDLHDEPCVECDGTGEIDD